MLFYDISIIKYNGGEDDGTWTCVQILQENASHI